ncbi:putative endonuclease [Ochrobactrum phage vB_OspM_OC]|nr:putative endonuclease [Ochrobactrum phage vB_OspM_OC]
MYYTIYKTTCLINSKIYIGAHKTNDLEDGYLGSGKWLKRAILKYGLENFTKEILFIFDNEQEMYAKEAELVNEYFVKETTNYNIRIGGFGGWDHVDWKGFKWDDERRKSHSKIKSIHQIGNGNSFYGKTHTDEAKAKIGAASKERAKGIYDQRMKDGNHPNAQATCPHCQKIGQRRAMLRWHFDNCKSIPLPNQCTSDS